jgi:hypothetical protein
VFNHTVTKKVVEGVFVRFRAPLHVTVFEFKGTVRVASSSVIAQDAGLKANNTKNATV